MNFLDQRSCPLAELFRCHRPERQWLERRRRGRTLRLRASQQPPALRWMGAAKLHEYFLRPRPAPGSPSSAMLKRAESSRQNRAVVRPAREKFHRATWSTPSAFATRRTGECSSRPLAKRPEVGPELASTSLR